MNRAGFVFSVVALIAMEVEQSHAAGTSPNPSPAPPDYRQDIQPLLASRCLKCHGPEKQKGGLRLDQKAAAFKGGDSGERGIVPKRTAESRLMQLVMSKSKEERMPPEGKPLSAGQIDLLKRWIDAGAVWPDAALTAAKPVRGQWSSPTATEITGRFGL